VVLDTKENARTIPIDIHLRGMPGITREHWHAEAAENLAQRRVLARRMAQVVRSLPELERQAADAVSSAPPPSALLQGANDAMASAALQQAVRDMAIGAGAVLSTTETLPAEQAGAYRRVSLRVAFAAPWPVMVRLMQAVGQASPVMMIEDLQVRGPHLHVGAGEPDLDASMLVFAFRAGTVPAGGQ
jgi:general secretion pathway protein M